MNSQPWWLPNNWLDVGLAIVGSACIVQFWRLHCRYRFGHKPRRYIVAGVSAVVTGIFLMALCLLDDQPWKQSVRLGLMWGSSAPVLWLGIQLAVLKWFPWLSPAVGACRREGPRDETWTPERRRELFEDTVEMKRPTKPNGQGGFLTTTMAAGIAGAIMLAAIGGLSWALLGAHEELGAQQVARALDQERIEQLEAEKVAAESSLAEKDRLQAQTAQRRTASAKQLQEVEHEDLDCPVPDSVRDILRHRRGGGHAQPNTPKDATPGLPAPRGRSGNAP